MDYQDLWLDCINKLSDLAYDTDALSEENIPSLPLIKDQLNGPIILKVMWDILELEKVLNGGNGMAIELTADSYLSFAFERGFLTYGTDDVLNMLMAINFLIDELQMDRVLLFRRIQMKEDLISPNKNIALIKDRIMDLAHTANNSECTSCEDAMSAVYSTFKTYNPILLNRNDYTSEDLQKLSNINSMFESLYHDKKIMMIQRLDVTIQSLLWDQRIQFDSSDVIAARNEIDITRSCSIDQLFEARRSLVSKICKVSGGSTRAKAKFRGVRIRDVPDRGGRVVMGGANTPSSHSSYIPPNKRYGSQKPTTSNKINKSDSDFNETKKVLQVFGSAMNGQNVVRSSNL